MKVGGGGTGLFSYFYLCAGGNVCEKMISAERGGGLVIDFPGNN